MLNRTLYLNETVFSPEVEMKATREALGEALVELGKQNQNVVVLTADWGWSARILPFKDAFPDRFVEMGIAEQNMMGVAAGLAVNGKIPFAVTLAIFNPGRNWEQIRLSVCFSNANVKIVGTHSGLSHCFDGGNAQALEDIALTRVLPNMTVIAPLDGNETKKAIFEMAKHNGPVYMRIGREATPVITSDKTPFEIGKARVLIEGNDVTILSTGLVGFEALVAAKDLKAKYKIGAEVIHCATVKPLDETVILDSVKKTGKVVTVEDHQIAGGFGSAIAELLGEKLPTKVLRIGVNDTFGQSGKYAELKDKYGISAHHIVSRTIKEFFS